MATRKRKTRSPVLFQISFCLQGSTPDQAFVEGHDPCEAARDWSTMHAATTGVPPTDGATYDDGACIEVSVQAPAPEAKEGEPAPEPSPPVQVRLYANQVWQFSAVEAPADDEAPEMIDQGFEDGRAQRPARFQENSDYMSGYALGRRNAAQLVKRQPKAGGAAE